LLPLKGENIIAWGIAPGTEIPTQYSPERAKQKLDYVSPFQGWYSLDVSILGRCPRLLCFPLSGEAKLKHLLFSSLQLI